MRKFYLFGSLALLFCLNTANILGITNDNSGYITLFQSGFEPGETEPSSLDSVINKSNVIKFQWADKLECSPRAEGGHTGNSAVMYSGQSLSKSGSYCTFTVFDVDITVESTTQLSYWINPKNRNGSYTAVDFICKDGSTLRDCGATDQNEISMHPNAGHGGNIPLDTWTEVKSDIGKWLNGKVIKQILVNYDNKDSAEFKGFIDDIIITTSATHDIKVSSISLSSPAKTSMYIGDSIMISATVVPDTATIKSYKYSVNKPTYASVDATGKVIAKKVGKIIVTAIAEDGSGIKASTEITINDTPITLFKSGFEPGDTEPTSLDSVINKNNVVKFQWADKLECSPRAEGGHTGNSAIMYSGQSLSKSGSYCTYTVFDVDITVESTTKMSYWINPKNRNGSYTAIDFICKDGTTLRDCGATDEFGFSMHPNAGHGGNIPLDAWTEIKSDIGKWLNGKVIKQILVNYDNKDSAEFKGFIDDIIITTSAAHDIKVSEINLTATATTMNVGDSIMISATVAPENATVKGYTYSINKASYASVDSTGKVIAKKDGVVIVTVTANDGSGVKATITITIGGNSIGVLPNSFSIYPNPVSDKLTISNMQGIRNIEIVSIEGKLVKSFNVNESSFTGDISALQSGLYIVRLIDNNNSAFTSKFVKR